MIQSTLATYLEKTFLFQFGVDADEHTDLFRAGIVDSHGYLQLMRYLQETFSVRFSRDELLSGVIATLSELVAIVESKVAADTAGRT